MHKPANIAIRMNIKTKTKILQITKKWLLYIVHVCVFIIFIVTVDLNFQKNNYTYDIHKVHM